MEYRRKNISSKKHLLNCVNPSDQNNGLRKFNVNSEDIGTSDLKELSIQAAIDIPDEDWELHKVYSLNPTQEIFIPFK